ncbi:MAG: hypothetical protein IKV85_00255 [Ruminococcus sp.]|nr:hypothetical protein [Ruminococcus sp.]
MSNIKYNEEQEAFELPYKLWDNMIVIRFYTESEEDITGNISEIAMKLETINGGKGKLSRMLTEDAIYRGSEESLKNNIIIEDIYADIDDDGIIFCFTVSSEDGYMEPQSVELYDGEFEIVGNAY